MERVVIESPFAAETNDELLANLQYLNLCIQDSLDRGEAPFASHYIYPAFLDDADPKQRKQGMEAGFKWLSVADRVAVYTDRGISSGMQAGINTALRFGLPVEKRSLKNG